MRTGWKKRAIIAVLLAGILSAAAASAAVISEKELLNQAVELVEQQDFAAADMKYQEAVNLNPDSFEAYRLWGLTYHIQYQQSKNTLLLDKEIEKLEKANQLTPDSVGVIPHLGMAYYLKGERQQAVKHLRQTLQLFPDHPERFVYQRIVSQAADPEEKL